MLIAWLSRALLTAFGLAEVPSAVVIPATPSPVAPPPPPCWCGHSLTDHSPAAGHDYAPAQGIESEAYDAW